MFVGKLTVLMSGSRVLLCLLMLSKIVMMDCPMVIVGGGVSGTRISFRTVVTPPGEFHPRVSIL
jgi:hypothetical protein